MAKTLKRFFFISPVILTLLLSQVVSSRQTKQTPPPSKPPTAAQKPSDTIQLYTQVVNVPVTVTDRDGRYIVSLQKENFQVYEDGVKQDIKFFTTMDAPVSIGVVFDISGSMKPRIHGAQAALRKLIDSSQEEDDFFLITFASQAKLVQDFTTNAEAIANALSFVTPKGSTALYDGAYLAVEKVRQGRHQRRALIIISDGGDNNSRYSFTDLKKLVREADVQIYALAIGDEEGGEGTLEMISRMTGGRAFQAGGGGLMLEDAVNRISLELRHQYNIGYTSQNPTADGKYRKIKVVVNPIRGFGKVVVRAREGYFAQKALEVAGNQ